MCFCGGDAVDERETLLCCALCCVNLACIPNCDCVGCSGKAGICCVNAEMCCKIGAPCLCPFGCLGIKCQNNECAAVNAQIQCLFLLCSCAIPCNKEVPLAVSVAGLTVFPKCGCCMKQKEIMDR